MAAHAVSLVILGLAARVAASATPPPPKTASSNATYATMKMVTTRNSSAMQIPLSATVRGLPVKCYVVDSRTFLVKIPRIAVTSDAADTTAAPRVLRFTEASLFIFPHVSYDLERLGNICGRRVQIANLDLVFSG
jgi:hypothetical protein